MNIAGVDIGPDHPARTVAEIGNAHNGALLRALRLIDAARYAGADFVKFQCYTPSELVELRGDGPAPEPWGSQGWSMHDLYTKAETPHGWFPDLAAHCERIGLPWFSSVFGPESLALLESLDCPAYKIAALDEGATGLRDIVEATRKLILASTHTSGGPCLSADVLFHCPPGYPQNPTDIDFSSIRFGGYDGLSYHGTDWTTPAFAVTCDASIVECHIQLDDDPSDLEADISLTATQFADMVKRIRQIEELAT